MTVQTLSSKAQDLSQLKLYRPGVLLAYFILGNLPVGMALYGLNIARRGNRSAGYALFAISALTLGLLILAAVSGRSLRGWTLLALVVGLGVFRLERRPYQLAVERGAKPARWWPPLLGMIVLLFVATALAPES